MQAPFVHSGDIAIRRMQDDIGDYLLMSRWLTDERVLEYYEGRSNPHDLERVIKKFGPRAQGEARVVPCIMVYRGVPIGYIQYYPLVDDEGLARHLETAEGVYGVDLFIGEPELWGRGIGTQALRAMVGYLFGALGARRVIIDPQTSNHRAIRCYEKCGFKKVKLLPRHELHEGEHRDCWLMAIDRLVVSLPNL
jgi:aminoglycoside 6'-N-acetyltransferase